MKKASAPGVLDGSISPYLLRQSSILFLGLLALSSLSLVDVYFIGQIGPQALAAVGFSTPIFLLGFNVLLSLGTGVTAVIARTISADPGQVEASVRGSMGLGLATGLLMAGLGWSLHDSLFGWMGATDELQPLLRAYMWVIYGSFPVMGLLISGLSVIRAYGATQGPTRIMLLIVLLNIGLDPVLIFGLGPIPALGMAGAAWATLIALLIGLVGTLISLGGSLWRRGTVLGLSEMLAIALPSAGTRLLLPLSGTLITGLLADFGPGVVAAYGIGYRLDVVILMFMIALSSVLAPFVGQNYGAGQYRRLGQGYRLALVIAASYGLAMALLLWLGHTALGPLFTDDPAILRALHQYYQVTPWGYAFSGALMLSTALLNVLHRPRRAALLSIVQIGAIYLPLATWAYQAQSLLGLFAAYPASLVCAAGLGLYMARSRLGTLADG